MIMRRRVFSRRGRGAAGAGRSSGAEPLDEAGGKVVVAFGATGSVMALLPSRTGTGHK